mgnify:FL=1
MGLKLMFIGTRIVCLLRTQGWGNYDQHESQLGCKLLHLRITVGNADCPFKAKALQIQEVKF